MTTTNDVYKGLLFKQTGTSIDEAKKRIADERSGEQHGLYCRYGPLNRAMLKYWRFRHVTLIAGSSGSGKSYFVNMLRQDFLDTVDIVYQKIDAFTLNIEEAQHVIYDPDTGKAGRPQEGEPTNALYYPSARLFQHDGRLIHKAINKGCKYKVINIHFGYEMDAPDELLRSAANVLGKSYGYLMSSEYDKTLKQYARVTDIESASCDEVLESFRTRKEFYIATSGNLRQLYWTVEFIANKYPDYKLCITIDHTLLSVKLGEKSDNELQAATARTCIDLRTDFDAMVIPVGQLNQNIEKDERILKPAMHYPGKSDIHCGAALWWACDNVLINHRPERLNIQHYGPDKLNTSHLIHGAMIKSSKGREANMWFRENFDNGRILSATRDNFKTG